ncbi:MAG: DUF1559 domain-containing protein [Planctomycetota bacterium]
MTKFHQTPNSVFRRGFTLIELLVVISIIALLISILLPALTSARQAALSMKCKTQLRQLGIAFATYADAHQGLIPPSLVTGSDLTFADYPAGTRWHTHFMIEWVDQNGLTALQQAQGVAASQGDNDIFICPTANATTVQVYQNSYGMNAILNYEHDKLVPPIVNSVNQWPRWRATFKDLYGVVRTSDAMLLIDNKNPSVTDQDYDLLLAGNVYSGPLADGAARHNGVNNTLFVDGHADSIELADIPCETNGNIRPDSEIDHFWFGR